MLPKASDFLFKYGLFVRLTSYFLCLGSLIILPYMLTFLTGGAHFYLDDIHREYVSLCERT